MDQVKGSKTFKFIKELKTTDWSNKVMKLYQSSQPQLDTSKNVRSPNKSKKKKGNETLDLSNIETVEHSKEKEHRSKKSSTPTPNKVKHLETGKSIMKNKSSDIDALLNVSNVTNPSSKPKKRNKSVSFMLEDVEEVVVKKSKSSNSSIEHKSHEKKNKNEELGNTKACKRKKNHHSKEHQNLNEDIVKFGNKENDATVAKLNDIDIEHSLVPVTKETSSGVKKKMKKAKRSKPETDKVVKTIEDKGTEEHNTENKKKLRKKKRTAKSLQENNEGADGEPAVKTVKKNLKPETIARGLESLNIGDNAHTLTNLLDEMTVVDRNKKKKDRQKLKRNKVKKAVKSENQDKAAQEDSKVEEKKKLKWNNRRWNKDSKGSGKPHLETSVVVENLPFKIMCSYKTLLSEHFSKFGTIAGIGVAEVYPTEDLKPVFTTTVFFQDEDAATKALEEDNTAFNGSRIRVRRPQPSTETTLVVHAYGLSDQALSSLFSGAGRVRAIRHLIKGKKPMCTSFVEFDGPEAVQRALVLAENAKINGKNIYVSKFKIRKRGESKPSENNDE